MKNTIQKLIQENPSLSNRRIASMAGCSEAYVRKIKGAQGANNNGASTSAHSANKSSASTQGANSTQYITIEQFNELKQDIERLWSVVNSLAHVETDVESGNEIETTSTSTDDIWLKFAENLERKRLEEEKKTEEALAGMEGIF